MATLTGHTHTNGYYHDDAGVHHIVLPAVLETPPGNDAYGWVDVYEDRLVVTGVDCMQSIECIAFEPPAACNGGARQAVAAAVGTAAAAAGM